MQSATLLLATLTTGLAIAYGAYRAWRDQNGKARYIPLALAVPALIFLTIGVFSGQRPVIGGCFLIAAAFAVTIMFSAPREGGLVAAFMRKED